ncbi:MAG TPA: ROK family protein [Candidatus Methylacidiphilales bacterium]
MALIALDIGGTKLLVAAADRSGALLRTVQAPTPRALGEGIELLLRLAAEAAAGEPVEAVGASCGGPLDAARGVVSPLHQPEWRGVPLAEIVRERLDCPFRVEVDTDAAALAEYRFGGEPSPRLLYLTLSTGMGGGFLVDGAIYRGHGGAHPEAGHQAIPYRLHGRPAGDGAPVPCACGAAGCLEALVSGTSIRRLYGKPAEELGDAEWEEVGHNLGLGLRNLVVLYAPERIVLGGGVATGGGNRFLPTAERTMREGLRLVPAPRLALSTLGYRTALLGAVALAQDALAGG